MTTLTRAFCATSLAALAVLTTQAQPANDNFANAWMLTGSVVTTNGNSGQNNQGIPNATEEAGEPNHAGFPGGRSVWFNWTPATSVNVRIDTIGSGFNTLLAVYTGNAVNALTLIVQNDDVGGGGQQGSRSRVEFAASAGVIYRIAIDGKGGFTGQNPASGAYVLNVLSLASVVITSPTNGTVVSAGTPLTIDVTATVPNPPVTRVDFYRAGLRTPLGSDNSAPFSTTVANPSPGSNNLYAVAVDSSSLSWTSTVVNVLVLNPGVTILSPSDGAVFLNNNPISLSAAALLPSGSMTNVEFFVDGLSFAQDSTTPFTAVWNSVTPGAHLFTAIGKSSTGASYVSSTVGIAVAGVLVASNSVWKYLDTGTDLGAAWIEPNFDDAAWASGPAPLGYGDSQGRPTLTTTSFGPDANNKYITTYLRQTLVVTNVASYTSLVMRVERDDAAIVYMNGIEMSRINLPAGVVAFNTPASGNAADDGTTIFTFTFNAPAAFLVEGTNIVTAEVHQDSATSSDIWFVMDLYGVPSIPRNQRPAITLTAPVDNAGYFAPASVTVSATASDADGTVTNVAFHVQDIAGTDTLLGNTTTEPYQITWNAPPTGWYQVYAVATDDQGAENASAGAFVSIYDADGTPLVQFLSPTNGAVFDGPTNLSLVVGTTAPAGATNVQFLANGTNLAQVAYLIPISPVAASFIWTNATFGTNVLTAVSYDDSGSRGTSAPITVVVTTPPPNLSAPAIAAAAPARGATLSNLTTIQVVFNERVTGVGASDLLVNGTPAASVTGSGSNYTFTITQPPIGQVSVAWVEAHGIQDVGFPPLPFDASAAGASWTYNLIDGTPPTIISRNPAANATVTNLSQISITFSESVAGVDAADLLLNGTPAIGLSGGGAAYTFAFSQPAAGAVNISWAGAHGITDLASPPNPFIATGAGATWSYTLDLRTILVQSNSTWLFIKAFAEASSPIDAWRGSGFNDSSWSNAPAPFFYGDPYSNGVPAFTLLSDMQGGAYSSIYLRKNFTITSAASITNLFLVAQSDDGFIAWINGVEVARVNLAAGDIPYNGAATAAANEQNNSAPYISYTLANANSYLVEGANVLAVHAFNNAPATSSDFGFNAQLYTFVLDPSLTPPLVSRVTPAAGDVFALTNITVRFSEPVGDVDAGDLRINGVAATSVTSDGSNTVFTFGFPQPAFGQVSVTWTVGHDIQDMDSPPKSFNGTAPGATFQYSLLNPSAPTVASQTPLAGLTVPSLTQLAVNFSEPVLGVDAADLRINGVPASGVSGGPTTYTFAFPQPPYGAVAIGWATVNGITDLEIPANGFDAARSGSSWTYNLVDQIPPVITVKNPAAGSLVTNLTAISVTFSEPVAGVNASDLRINSAPATGVTGSGAGPYTFTFAQPNATLVNVTWAAAHGIRDLATAPNSFDAGAPGATWSYSTPDTLRPSLAGIDPPPFVTVRSLTQIRVTFTETVVGVDTNDLLLNGVKARQVTGGGSGPYTFTYLPPTPGPVDVRWTTTNGITDLALPMPNTFAGGEWTYSLDPNATFAGKVLINEIMFDPPGGAKTNEWIELRNVATNLINLAGWRFTKGLDFTFPNVSIPAGGHLVAAANLAAFQSKYPDVTNVIGGWTGSLANSDETIEFETALGESVNSVHYASDGDWAQRVRGNGSDLVESINRNGTTATVSIFQHTYSGNDQVIISGADQPEYNGRFTVSGAGGTTFNIAVNGTPATPATGNIICRWVLDDAAAGWSWFNGSAGFGHSLELANPVLPNSAGQNWLASASASGTPGRANSAATNNVAPLVQEVTHFPPVPKSSDSVAITARVRDELSNGVAGVTLFYRDHTAAGPSGFSSTNLLDDGAHSDGVRGDGLFGAVLPPGANGSVIEFYVQATDTGGRVRTWPAPSLETNGPGATFGTPGQFANALYQVDNESITNAMGSIRLVLSGTERALFPPGNRNSDAAPNCTFISTDGDGVKIRYLCSARVRGAGSRSRTPPNNRIDIPGDNRWNGLASINLNSQFVHAQLLGNNFALKSGLPAEPARVVQYRINGVNPAPVTAPQNGGGNGAGWGVFLLVEPANGDLAGNLFPQDGGGNYYRASTGNHNADFSYQNGIPANYLGRGYYKTSNRSENDWSDMAALTFALSQVVSDADYVEAVSTNVNVREWMTYFAVGSLVNFSETALFNGRGDDYALYRGELDKRFVVLGHDFDTIFGQGDTTGGYTTQTNASIYLMINPPNGNANVPNLNRFMRNARFAPLFYAELKRICDTTLHPTNFEPLVDQFLGNWNGPGPDANVRASIKNYAANRRANVLSQIPLTLTVNSSLTAQNGYLSTTTPDATLFGSAHAIDTRKVLVNGVVVTWSAFDARWTNTVTLRPGINRVLVQSLDGHDVEFARATVDIWYDDSTVTSVSGAIAADTTWIAANGPYQVTANLTVNSGATLTIQPGTTVYLNSGVNFTVANGGRLLAEGTDTAPIRFSRAPGVATSWGGLTVNGAASSPETRIAHTHFEFNGATAIEVADGTVFLDHLTFGNTGRQYVSLDRASFVVQDCVFPATTASFEPVHGTGGIKAGGRGIVRRNFWGRINGYNDAFDFTGGNRPGPILQVINNVFAGSDDDLLDFDSTDAWVEGNIFLHTHRNGSPDSASAISGGADNADTSQITAVGNLFFDVDHAANAKQGNFYTLLNNTIVHQTKVGSQDTNTAVVILADQNEQGTFTAQGAGMYLEGNIIFDAENLTRHVTTAVVTYSNNIIHQLTGAPWTGPGGGNVNVDPLLKRIPPFSETTNFTSWAAAQVMWDYFSLRPGSPARAAGPNGRDQGGVIPFGASISGEPVGTTPLNTATLRVGANRTGNGIPPAGFPNGSGFTHYQWRLDGGVWSAETPAATPIALNGLASGAHYVEVSGKNDAGFYQDDPVFGIDGGVTVSRTWHVNPLASPLRLNEILASNGGTSNHFGATPDLIELWNTGPGALDLSGVGLTDDPANPAKFLFPLNTTLAAGAYLTIFADSAVNAGFHLGFNLPQSGGAVYLYDSAANGGALIDSVNFGLQITDLSIGRLNDGSWVLTVPTFSGLNRAAATGDPRALRINEWLAIARTPFSSGFVELYNTDARPVALGGLYLSDEPLGWPDRHQMAALSFIAGSAYLRLLADGNAGADHLNFSVNGDQGGLSLSLPDLTMIDCVVYQAQQPNVSQGRSPNGSTTLAYFATPTPGSPNPLITGPEPNGGVLVINEVLAVNSSRAELDGRTPDWIELYNGSTVTVNLGDLSLTDNTLLPRKYIFAAGTLLAPGAYLRVLCDPGATGPGPLATTNFAFSGTGGGVYLYDSLANGGSLLNSVTYGLQVADLSIGRVPDGSTNWFLTSPTPGGANTALPSLGDATTLRVNEWMADGGIGNDDWFEIYNPDPKPVALGGFYLTDDLNNRTKHPIPALSFIGFATNGYIQFHADGNTGAGADHVSFSLRVFGEALGISSANGTLIDGVDFGQQTSEVSEGRFPDGSTNFIAFTATDSPGAPNYRLLTTVVINEALTHTDEPLEDAIELRNLTGTPIDVSGWWLSDDRGALRKYQIPFPTTLPPFGFTVIYETHFTNRTEAAVPFALSSHGDEIVLSAATNNTLTGYRTFVKFGAADNGVSFGRHVTSDGREEFVAMSTRTLGVDDPSNVQQFRTGTGKTNAYPKVGPVVISEIMYHPPDVGTNDNAIDEFIELHNITTVSVPLYDPAAATNVWRLRDAVDFDFPTRTVLPAGGYLLAVSFDPINNPGQLAAFRARYNVASGTPIVGPWIGKLSNNDDDLELRKPGVPDTNGVDSILVEHVHYRDLSPWPDFADGTGLSLQRASDPAFGNDPGNWTAGAPTPGPQNSSYDTDSDGLPDSWETIYGLDPFNPGDADLDSDGDGLTNLQEYQMGTNPRDASNGLRIASHALTVNGSNFVLTFTALASFTYTIEYTDALGSGLWQAVSDIAAAPTNRVISFSAPATGPARFYRVRTPWGLGSAGGPRIDAIQALPGGRVSLTFTALANRSYTLLFATQPHLNAGSWSIVTSYPAAPTDRVIETSTPATGSGRFYRLRTP